jgi:hypothetical protein
MLKLPNKHPAYFYSNLRKEAGISQEGFSRERQVRFQSVTRSFWYCTLVLAVS